MPRVHQRPRAPIMSRPPPLTAPLVPLRTPPPPPPTSQQPLPSIQQPSTVSVVTDTRTLVGGIVGGGGPVSLIQPRPENERATNEYVETPFRQPPPSPPPPPQPPRSHHRPTRLPLHPPLPPVVTKQPGSGGGVGGTSTFVKEHPAAAPLDLCTNARSSIMCPECGRCRCDSCRQPRPLPQRWVCNDGCLLSADSAVDYASCLCCAKALFYHCAETEGGESCADDPCGCGPDRRKTRWCCLASLSCVLPCLWFYWPLRGCKKLVEECYARHTRSGCRCRRPAVPTPEKRLLDSNSDF